MLSLKYPSMCDYDCQYYYYNLFRDRVICIKIAIFKIILKFSKFKQKRQVTFILALYVLL